MRMVFNILERLTKDPKSVVNPSYRCQLWVTLTLQIFTLSHGIATGWSSPTVHKLQLPDSPTNFVISVEQTSWVLSLYGLGAFVGNILYGLLINRIGRKWCMSLMALPQLIAWILKFFAATPVYLYAARFLVGASAGANYVVTPIFICEIADCNIRGALCAMYVLFISFGILFGYVMSSHLNYYLVPCIVISLPLLYTFLITRFPESPQYLLRTQKIEEARKSFHYYKRITPPTESQENIVENAEFQELRADVEKSFGKAEALEAKDFFNARALLGFCTAFVLIILSQFSGSLALISYTTDIFAYSGSDFDPNTCTIYIGVAQIVGGFCSTLLVDRFGRKRMMLASTAGHAICVAVFGVYMDFTTDEMKLQFGWVPLVIMIGAVIAGACGVIGLVFTVIVEVIPTKIRGIGNSISMAAMSVTIFVSLKILPVFLHAYGLATMMYSCCGVCVVCWIYLFIFQIETNGVSMNK